MTRNCCAEDEGVTALSECAVAQTGSGRVRRCAHPSALVLLALIAAMSPGVKAADESAPAEPTGERAPKDIAAPAESEASGGTGASANPRSRARVGQSAKVAEHIEDEKAASSQTVKHAVESASSETPAKKQDLTPIALPTGVDKSGVTGKSLSIPKGEGTIEGMGESFSAQLSTGIATYSVPIALPKARGQVSVNLALSYSSSSGHGLAGVGWDIGAPFIARQTDRGLPSYDDQANWHPGQDRFVFNGGQELVPICTVSTASGSSAGGTCAGALVGETFPTYVQGWQYFRSRVEGSFQRFFWSADHRTWLVQDKSGVTLELGVPLDGSGYTTALEVNPDPSSPGKQEIFRWHIVRQYDAHFSDIATPLNSVVYRWQQEGNQAYLSDIYDTPAVKEGGVESALTGYAHHVHLAYEKRSDPTQSYRSGWRIDQNWRLSGLDVTSKSFNGGLTGPRHLVRRYHLSYDPSYHASLLSQVQVEGRCGSDEQNAPSEGADGNLPMSTECERLPPMTFSYQHVEPYTSDGKPGARDLPGFEGFDERLQSVGNSPAHSVDEEYTDLFDVNADGLPDVLVTAAGLYGPGHGVFFNQLGQFAGVTPMGITGALGADAGTITLHNPNVTSLDIDGDGRVNLVHVPIAKTYAVYDAVQKAGSWYWQGREIAVATNQNVKIDFGRDTHDVQVLDVNFDGLVDVVVSTGTEFQTFFSLGRLPGGDGQFGQGQWKSASTSMISNDPVSTCVPYAGLPIRLSDKETKLADMNGDGIVDLVKLQRGQVRYWPGRGNGLWGTGKRDDCPAGSFAAERYVGMTSSPNWSDLSGDSLRIDDVNGDGLSDLVQVRFDGVDVWLNVDGVSFTERHVIENTPASPSFAQRVRLTDINGSGTPDVLWASASHFQYMDLTGGKRPHLLIGVSNGLGKQTTLEYSSSANEMAAAEAKGACDPSNPPADIWSKGWCSRMPTVTSVVKRVTESDQLTVAGQGPSKLVTEYEYRDPVFEGRQREFRGFRHARATRVGDNNSPSDVTESSFLLGECTDNDPSDGIEVCSPAERWRDNGNEALKGLPWLTQKRSSDGIYLSSEVTTYSLRKLYAGLDGRAIKHAVATAKSNYLYDTASTQAAGTALSPTIVVESEFTASSDGKSVTEKPGASTSASLVPRAGAVVTASQSEVDAFGNQTKAVASGCVSGCEQGADETLTNVTTPALIADDATRWLWRTTESYTTGSAHGDVKFKHQSTTYNRFGEATVVSAELLGSVPLDRRHPNPSKAVAGAPEGASADTLGGALIELARTDYDAYGNPKRVSGPNGRCGDVSYDTDYAQLPTSEVLYKSGCGGDDFLNLAASYDRGFGKVTIAIDMQGQPTKAVYDGFGRTIELTKPDPAGGGLSAKPSVKITYWLPPSLGNPALSAIRTETEDGAGIGDDNYLEAWSFVDGFGRSRTQLSESEVSGQWIVSNLVTHDAKGAARRKYVEYYYQGEPTAFPIAAAAGTLYGSQRYDAFGRVLQTFDLDGTVTLQARYHAQSKDLYDAADLEPGAHQDTYATEVTDGHGRVIRATERVKTSGHIEQRHILTVYNPLGGPEIMTRRRAEGSASADVTRWMRYDTLGRLVVNYDSHVSEGFVGTPNVASPPDASQFPGGSSNTSGIHTWRYAYNDAGDLVGTSDARGCGTNFRYDGLGRLLGEDYSPCEVHHANYSPPSSDTTLAPTLDGWEVAYAYDAPPSGVFLPESFGAPSADFGLFWIGRLVAVADRGALSVSQYDGRGRVVKTARRIAKPAEPGQTPDHVADRYAPRWYFTATTYDAADRPALTSAGLRSTEMQAASVDGIPYNPAFTQEPDYRKSTVAAHYSTRGTLGSVDGSYGSLLASIQRRADGLVEGVTYGDLAGTTTVTGYDGRRRPTSIQTFRAAPGQWGTNTPGYTPVPAAGGTSTSFQLLLQDLDITYDIVGNPTEIRDWRDPAEWPVGAKPVTRKIAYDDLYRVRQVKYEYSTNDEDWVSPYLKENSETSSNRDHRRSAPSPHVNFPKRVLQQDIEYDWLGNTFSSDDDAHGFYDRSLGDIVNDAAHGRPYQLASASNAGAGGSRTGSLATKYDVAGNLTDMAVSRNGPCLPSGSSCNQRFHYGWDEVGRLVRAQRWDTATPVDQEPSGNAVVDLAYAYDASDNRVLKSATANEGAAGNVQRHAVYISGGQELRGAQFGTTYGSGGVADYQVDSTTEVAYLFAHGVRLGRVAYDAGLGLPAFGAITTYPQQHVLINLDDTLGSTAIVIDRETGELVESTAYLANGATESDYRADRWKGLREDYRFTGKEEDVEVGLQYFGKRFLSPYLGRWVSADPLAVHVPGKADFNLYAYVHGQTLKNVDPIGLEDGKPLVRVLVFRSQDVLNDQAHQYASDLADNWSTKDKSRMVAKVQPAARTGGWESPDTTPDGLQHAQEIARLARDGAKGGSEQHLRVFVHGSLGEGDSKGNPTDAKILLGANRDVELSYANLAADSSSLTGSEAAQREQSEAVLSNLRDTFAATGVKSITFEGCNVGRFKPLLDILRDKLGVEVRAPNAYLTLEGKTKANSSGQLTTDVTMRFNKAVWQDGEWKEGGATGRGRVNDLANDTGKNYTSSGPPQPTPEK